MIHDKSPKQEASITSESIRVGACGWQHAHWQGTFYPDDMPGDWRLSYYANEFSTVLVPQACWLQRMKSQECSEHEDDWLDVPESFRFYLALDDEQYRTPLRDFMASDFVASMQGRVLGGVSTQADYDAQLGVAMIKVGEKDLRGWRQWLEQFESLSRPLNAVILTDPDLKIQPLFDFKALLELMQL